MEEKYKAGFRHESVLLAEAVEQLQVKPEGIYADGTLGGGGNAAGISGGLRGGCVSGVV